MPHFCPYKILMYINGRLSTETLQSRIYKQAAVACGRFAEAKCVLYNSTSRMDEHILWITRDKLPYMERGQVHDLLVPLYLCPVQSQRNVWLNSNNIADDHVLAVRNTTGSQL